MKKSVKKFIEGLLTIIACVSFCLMCAERPDGSICLAWNLGWLGAFTLCAVILDKMGAFKKVEDVK